MRKSFDFCSEMMILTAIRYQSKEKNNFSTVETHLQMLTVAVIRELKRYR